MPLEVETASPWWGCLCACSLASQKPSERKFFVPARTDLGVKLLNRFNGGIGTSMRKAAHPLGGVGSSNPRRWRGKRLHNHGDGVCLFVLFVPSCLVVVTRRM